MRDPLATLVVRRGGEFFDIFQQPLRDGVTGMAATVVAQQVGGAGGRPSISMYGGHGAIGFVQPDAAGENAVRLQRIGCE